ncbi:hypothetical protein [Thauera sinica]|uniref:Uncharacterized protein n=1 Tax=Thauera sinica TaxID=2665146 RepID=A0ABW1AUM1_9RHOO|nr:hypothetical protein [Thauera sp. K11]ATE58586.1 hypothetical protein CCZ27_00150 [Thauera sp. K11]
MSLHPELLAAIGHEFGDRLAAPPQLTQDALIVPLPGGTTLTVRYAARDAYSLRWQVSGGGGILDMGIDTAPVHPALGTRPNHLHLPDGRVVADPLTSPDAAPAANVAAVVSALLADPRLSSLTA